MAFWLPVLAGLALFSGGAFIGSQVDDANDPTPVVVAQPGSNVYNGGTGGNDLLGTLGLGSGALIALVALYLLTKKR